MSRVRIETMLGDIEIDVRGDRAPASAGYHSFFICRRDEPALDLGGLRHPDGQGFAAFGQVAGGWDAVERIFARAEEGEYLKHEVGIVRAHLIA